MIQLIINLLDSNTVDSIILAKMLYGKIRETKILRSRVYEYHFVQIPKNVDKIVAEERIYVFRQDKKWSALGRLIGASFLNGLFKAYPHHE